MMLVFHALELLASFIECYVGYHFNALFLQQKSNKKQIIFLSSILSIIIFGMNMYALFSISTSIIALVFISVSACICMKTSFIYSFSITLFFSACLLLFDFFSMSLVGTFGNQGNFAVQVIREQSLFRYSFVLISKTLLVLSFFAVRKILCKFQIVEFDKLLLITLFGYIGIVFMAIHTFETINFIIVINWLFLIVVIFLLFFTLAIFLRYKTTISEKELIKLRNEIIAKSYKEIASDYRKNALLFHDMNNHIQVLHNMVERQEYERAYRYLGTMSDIISATFYTWTGNDTIDCIINIKKKTCDELNISLLIDATPINMKENDFMIGTILSNLVDNAIGACLKVEAGGWITISVRHIHEMLMIKIKNVMCDMPTIKDGILETHKLNKSMHGLGIKSVEAAVKKLDGVFTYDFNTDEFTALVTIFL